MDEEEILENEMELESLVRTLASESVDQEIRNLLVLKSSFLSDYMKSITDVAKNPALNTDCEEQKALLSSLNASMGFLTKESGTLMEQFNKAIDETLSRKNPPALEVNDD